MKALPGVTDAAYASFAPLTIRGGYVLVTIEGAPAFTRETIQRYIVSDRVVTPGTSKPSAFRCSRGRHFDERDMAASAAPRS